MLVFLLADLYYQVINGNPLNLDVEKLSNVPGKYFKRKRWRCRNGLGFVKFIYEGQVAVTRICGRDFFINGQPGSLPYLVSNEEIGQFHHMFSRFLIFFFLQDRSYLWRSKMLIYNSFSSYESTILTTNFLFIYYLSIFTS